MHVVTECCVHWPRGVPISYNGDLRNDDAVLGWITRCGSYNQESTSIETTSIETFPLVERQVYMFPYLLHNTP